VVMELKPGHIKQREEKKNRKEKKKEEAQVRLPGLEVESKVHTQRKGAAGGANPGSHPRQKEKGEDSNEFGLSPLPPEEGGPHKQKEGEGPKRKRLRQW